MKVIRAEVLGMCFGVRDALSAANEVERPREVVILGELVHNEKVTEGLRRRGFQTLAEVDRGEPPNSARVLVTAHGISQTRRRSLEAAGKTIIDTTCPLVTRAHDAAARLRDEGYFVLVVGKRGHVEVLGIVEDLKHFEVIESPDEVKTYSATRLGIVCQTTSTEELVHSVREAAARRNPRAEIRFIDTVCRPTKDHQHALEALIDQVEAVVVVGGKNSNNTRALVERCQQRGVPARHVQSARELDAAWCSRFEIIGLTAGTSTLDATIDEVESALSRIGAAREVAHA